MASPLEALVAPLLRLPVLSFHGELAAAAAAGKKMAFPEIIARRTEYNKEVEALVASAPADDPLSQVAVREQCIDYLLRYFNAANFVGDLHEALTIGTALPAGIARPVLPAVLQAQQELLLKKDEAGFAQLSLSSRLALLAPRVFEHFRCADIDEMPSSSFAIASKSALGDTADSTSNHLPPQPYRLLLRSLTVDGEPMEPSVRRGALLAAALALAATLPKASTLSAAVWRMRAVFRHQLSLTYRANTLYTALMECITGDIAMRTDIPKSQAPALALEMAHIYAFYHRPEGAQRFLQQAVETSGLALKEDSFLGVRTRYQQTELPQLIVSAASDAADLAQQREANKHVYFEEPVTVQSEASGHDILDRPRRKGCAETPDGAAPLLLRDYATVLALCSHLKQSNAESGITGQQAHTYIERLMVEEDARVPWALRAMALLLRARFEYGRNRVQERAFLQYQELVDTAVPEGGARLCGAAFSGFTKAEAYRDETQPLRNGGADAPVVVPARLDRCDPAFLFYSVSWPSRWALRREYGERCFGDTLYKTALELFEQTLDWPNIIKCCKQLDRRNKAASLAEDLLKEDPDDVMLWVALGEARRDEQPLFHAWELCQHMMAAPMRALAKMALDRERFEDVVTYFEQSTRINPIFGVDWFSLGYASMRLQHQGRASEAFTRVCQIEPDNAYAWTNLGGLLMKRGQLRPAFNAMSQALRNERTNWHMWDNYFRTGVEIKEVTEAAHALRIVTKMAGTRKWEPELESLEKFARLAIDYIRGNIDATNNDIAAPEEAQPQQQGEGNGEGGAAAAAAAAVHREKVSDVTIPSLAGTEDLRIPSHPVAAEVLQESEGGDKSSAAVDPAEAAAAAGLRPLFSDIPDVPDAVYKDTEQKHREMDIALRARFEKRTRELLAKIGGDFVTKPEVHNACAVFFGALDGPLAEMTWRERQLREEKQQPLWERTLEKLQRVIVAATALAKAAIEAEKQPAAAAGPAASTSTFTTTSTTTPTASTESPKKRAITALNHVVEKAAPHFDDAEVLRPLQVLLMKLKKSQ